MKLFFLFVPFFLMNNKYKGLITVSFLMMVLCVFYGAVSGISNTTVVLGGVSAFHVDFVSVMFFMVSIMIFYSILNFSEYYMALNPGVTGFKKYIIFFYYFMIMFVSSGNFLLVFLGWEAIGILSFILIMFWVGRSESKSGASQALLFNRLGDFFMFVFIALLYSVSGNLGTDNNLCLWVLVFSILVKSSMFPFHGWLPNAMEGPTPVSALLHSSTMVVASVYLFMRLKFFFGVGLLLSCLLFIGVVTFFLSSYYALNSSDLKKVIAYSTVSHLGLMVINCLVLGPIFCLFHMLAHSVFKASLFMMSGHMIHGSSGDQNSLVVGEVFLNSDSVVKYYWLVNNIVLMGIPYFSLYLYKETPFLSMIYYGGSNLVLSFVYIMSMILSFMYALKLFLLVWGGGGLFDSSILKLESSTLPLSQFMLMFLLLGWLYLGSSFLNFHFSNYILGSMVLFFMFLILFGSHIFFLMKSSSVKIIWDMTDFFKAKVFFSSLNGVINLSKYFDFWFMEKYGSALMMLETKKVWSGHTLMFFMVFSYVVFVYLVK